jgi:hypothetical protein
MATVQGIREKVQTPVYDCFFVKPAEQLRDVEPGSTLKFFVNVQGKTKLETNLQSASLLPHFNTFEARAMRVVISDLPPEYPVDSICKGQEQDVINEQRNPFEITVGGAGKVVVADVEAGLKFVMEKLEEALETGVNVEFLADDDDENKIKVKFKFAEGGALEGTQDALVRGKGSISLSASDLEKMIESLNKTAPPKEQIRPNDGAGNLIGKLIYNTVTTFFVGEKIMIEMPTWFFPGGAGPYSLSNKVISHGEPSPLATFRFAEPIFIDKQQNFRVEIDIPDSDTHKEIQKIYGPLFMWVVLDGYMTRDVQ